MTKRREPASFVIWRFWILERVVDFVIIVLAVLLADHIGGR